MIVIDASVVVKWYAVEAFSDLADTLYTEHQGTLIAPDILVAEVIGALVRRANMHKDLRAESERSIRSFLTVLSTEGVAVQRMSAEAMRDAATLALDLGHALKDCIYLQLAIARDCPLVTADARFAATARGMYAGVKMLG